MKCYNRLTGLKEVVDTSGVSNMLFGDAGQILIQRLYPKEFCEFNPIESPVPTHIDIFEDCKYPLEVKWSGQKIYRIEDIPSGWMLQLMRYMALTKSETGWMIIINLTSRQLTTFKIMMDQKELEEQYKLIIESRDRILQAVKDRNPEGLIVNLSECNWCPYRNRRGKDKSETCSKYVPRRDTEAAPPPSAT